MFADFLTVIPQTPSMVLITYRPEYGGALTRIHGAQTIALAPLSDSESSALLDELLGRDPSVAAVRALIADRAAGNPFFAQEIVREFAERGVLDGDRGAYACRADLVEVSVPATLQVTIAAPIDRLDPKAKRTLSAAAVIGSRFGIELQVCTGQAITLKPGQRRSGGLADYAAPGELAVLPLGEPVKRCLLGPLKRFLGGLGVPTLSSEVPTGEFDASTDSFDGWVDGFEVSAAGFGFLPNGFGFPSGLSGGLVISDVVPDRFGVPASGFVFLSSRFLGVASVRGTSA